MAQKKVPCDFFSISLELLHFPSPILVDIPIQSSSLSVNRNTASYNTHKPSLARIALGGLTQGQEEWTGMQSKQNGNSLEPITTTINEISFFHPSTDCSA
jgi:hypothetical protein